MPEQTPPEDNLLIARIGGAHGIAGEVRLETFTEEPEAVMEFSPLTTDRAGLSVRVTSMRRAGRRAIASLEGIGDRSAAEALAGVRLYVPRSVLPKIEAEDEYYHADLIGMNARTGTGEVFGKVTAIFNFGAGDILEITPSGGPPLMVPFTRRFVPEVDVKGGIVTVEPASEASEAPAGDTDGTGAAQR